jgi:hypothetical protein
MSVYSNSGGGFGSRLFSSHAPDYAEYGLTVFPVGGKNGKIPQVKNWRKFGPHTWEKLSSKFENDNIGIVNKTLTIIDIDDPELFHKCLNRFGDTPIKIETPSGGFHLWYKASGEQRRTRIDGLKVDVLGKGGFGVAPPSVKRSGGNYHFIEGDVTDIPNLPTLKSGAVPNPQTNTDTQGEKGQRNKKLFSFCLKAARGVKSEDSLAEIALTENQKFDPPMDAGEVYTVVKSAWEYQSAGKNLTGRNAILIDAEVFEKLAGQPDAFYLMTFLTKNHGGLRDVFFIDQEKVSEVLRWGNRRRIANAIKALIERRLIQYIGKGGITGRSHQYRLIG